MSRTCEKLARRLDFEDGAVNIKPKSRIARNQGGLIKDYDTPPASCNIYHSIYASMVF